MEKIKYIITDFQENTYGVTTSEEMGEIRERVRNTEHGFKIFKVKLIEDLDEK